MPSATAKDPYAHLGDDGLKTSRALLAIVPNDAADLTQIPKAIRIGGAGDVTLIAVDDSAQVLIKACQEGEVLQIQAKRVLATGTTATYLVGLL